MSWLEERGANFRGGNDPTVGGTHTERERKEAMGRSPWLFLKVLMARKLENDAVGEC